MESRLDSLNLHGVGSLGSLNCRSVSRGDGTIGMANNGRGTLVDRSRHDSTSTLEGCLGCFHLRSVGRDNSSIGMVDSSRRGEVKSTNSVVEDRLGRGGGHTGQENLRKGELVKAA